MPRKEFSPEAIDLLVKKSWTGNIRELRNVVERLLILGANPVSVQDIEDYVILGHTGYTKTAGPRGSAVLCVRVKPYFTRWP